MSSQKSVKPTTKKAPAHPRRRRARAKPPQRKPASTKQSTEDARTDPRVQTENTFETAQLSTQTSAINVSASMEADTLYGISVSYVSIALSRGALAFVDDPSVPGFAAQFLFDVLMSYVNGTAVQTPQLPRWVRVLGASLAPKQVKFQSGQIAYKFITDNPAKQFVSPFTIGYVPYGYTWTPVGVNTSTLVNLFPTCNGNLPAYDADSGARSFNAIAQFMSQKEKNYNSEIVPAISPTEFERNVSAFAVCALQEGCGSNLLGGVCYQAQLEVPIYNPLLTKFVRGQQPNQLVTRNYNLSQLSSGDTLYTGGALACYYTPQEWHARRAPRFHFIDFDEFVDVCGRWVQLMQTSAHADPSAESASIQCPLTFQEFQLLLRATFMSAFRDTQPLVQSLYPRNPQASNSDEFVAFVCGANCCPIQDPGMLLPVPVIENIRALTSRKFRIPGTKAHDIQAYVGVVGKFAQSYLDSTDYFYDDVDVPLYSFRQDANTVRREVHTKKGVDYQLVSEVPIDIVDGTSNSDYVFINDPGRLSQLADLWNEWISSSGLSSYSTSLGTVGTELGIKVLASVAMTRHWIPDPHPTSHPDQDVRILKRRKGLGNFYVNRGYYAVTSQSPIMAVSYQQVLSQWILPTNKAVASNYSDASSIVQRWQEIEGQPFLAAETSGDSTVNYESFHYRYAERMIKSKFSKDSDWETFFKEMEKQGRGGILSGLGNLLDNVFGI